MNFINGTTDIRLKKTAVTLGKFDGLHKGHQLLLNELEAGRGQGLETVMFTFQCHPNNLFSDKEISLINTEEENQFFLDHGRIPAKKPDILVSYPFTRETASMTPEEFIKEVLAGRLDAKVIVVGDDYRFGSGRRGDIDMLRAFSGKFGYELIVKEKVEYQGEAISSTRIRSELSSGRMEEVRRMLGYPYTILGTVAHGNSLGHKMLLPTINLYPAANKLLPPDGVYYSVTQVDGREYAGVTNIGYKPTVGGETGRDAETYLFDFDRDIYGRQVEVELYHFERPEKKFSSFELLKAQITKDAQNGREYFRRHIMSGKAE